MRQTLITTAAVALVFILLKDHPKKTGNAINNFFTSATNGFHSLSDFIGTLSTGVIAFAILLAVVHVLRNK